MLKVSMIWISIVYVICFAGVALFPGIREGFMLSALHMRPQMSINVLTLGTFMSGLIIWNFIMLVAVWLFATLYNAIKE